MALKIFILLSLLAFVFSTPINRRQIGITDPPPIGGMPQGEEGSGLVKRQTGTAVVVTPIGGVIIPVPSEEPRFKREVMEVDPNVQPVVVEPTHQSKIKSMAKAALKGAVAGAAAAAVG